MTALRWTRERPTMPGWYWFRNEEYGTRIVFAFNLYGDHLCFAPPVFGADHDRPVECEWAGPIPEPIGGGDE